MALAEYLLLWRQYLRRNLRRNVAVTTRLFAIILVILESPYKALEHNVGQLSIKALVCY